MSGFEIVEVPEKKQPAPSQMWNHVAIEELAKKGHLTAAAGAMRRALGFEPDNAVLLSNYGNVLRRMGDYDRAEKVLSRALELDGEHPDVLFNNGVASLDWGWPTDAIDLIDRALAARPGDPNFTFARASALLSAARFREGFAAYQCRLNDTSFGCPYWDGNVYLTPGGKPMRLLLHAEQGLGDTIMFHRYVPNLIRFVEDRGGVVDYVVHPPLSKLLGGQVAGCEVPDPDFHLPIMSIPHLLGHDYVSGKPYLKPQHKMGFYRPPGLEKKIGICWRAKTTVKSMTLDERQHGEQKSMPLAHMLELTRFHGAALYSLQHQGRPDIDALEAHHLVFDLGNQMHDFTDLASYIDQMDLVVTVDTAVAHLAGALGKRTIVCLHNSSAWHWTTGMTTPWYENTRILRPITPGRWDVEAICTVVGQELAAMEERKEAADD